jgi:hypothetical protein
MTPSTTAPELGLLAELPVTFAGLWTALTMTQDLASGPVDHSPQDDVGIPERVAAACAEAADCLAVSRREALPPSAQMPDSRALEPTEGPALLGALLSGCIDLAVELLGNEDEPLSPAEVLAVSRAVTALCSARSLAEGRVA